MSNIVYLKAIPPDDETLLPLLWPVFHHLVDAIVPAAVSGGKLAVLGALPAPHHTDGLPVAPVLSCVTAILRVELAGAVDGERGVSAGELLVARLLSRPLVAREIAATRAGVFK